MRIISGKFKGRILRLPRGVKIRPTKDVVKEALFSILGEQIEGASFLELFAGSGSVGIEAKSRGAKRVFFIEENQICVQAIAANLTHLKIPFNYGLKNSKAKKNTLVTILPDDAERAIKAFKQEQQKFDFIFLDPPYHQDRVKNCLINTRLCDILNARSFVLAEHNQSQILPQQLSELRLMLTKKYGDTVLSIYQKGA